MAEYKENTVKGKAYRICTDSEKNTWDKVSLWTAAEDVELSNGKNVETEMSDLKKSVSDGKGEVAAAITGRGIPTSSDASFHTMATNITNLKKPTGKKNITISSPGTKTEDITDYEEVEITTSGLVKPTNTISTHKTYGVTESASLAAGTYLEKGIDINGIAGGTYTLTNTASDLDITQYTRLTTSGLVKPLYTNPPKSYPLTNVITHIPAGTYFPYESSVDGVTGGNLTLTNVTSGTNCINYSTVSTSGLVKPERTISKIEVYPPSDLEQTIQSGTYLEAPVKISPCSGVVAITEPGQYNVVGKSIAYTSGLVKPSGYQPAKRYYVQGSDLLIASKNTLCTGDLILNPVSASNLNAAYIKSGVTVTVYNGQQNLYVVKGTYVGADQITYAKKTQEVYEAYNGGSVTFDFPIMLVGISNFAAWDREGQRIPCDASISGQTVTITYCIPDGMIGHYSSHRNFAVTAIGY